MGIDAMNTAYIFGCSHAMGSEVEGEGIGNCTPYNLANSFTSQLAKLLGYTPVNMAIPGASNDYVFRNIHDITATADDLIIASWTGTERIEIFDDVLGEWLNFSTGMWMTDSRYTSSHKDFYKFFQRFFADEFGMRGNLNKTKNVSAGNAIAGGKGIPIINIDSFSLTDQSIKNNLTWAMQDTTFVDWVEERKFSKTEWCHYGLDAHTAFAHALYEDINHRKLIR
jgi:hypothetical protein